MADSKLSCQWFSKNFESLEATGKLKFITSQDYFSYSGNRKKIIRASTVSGRLTTLLGYSFTDADIIQGFGFLISELFARYYQKKGVYMCVCLCIHVHISLILHHLTTHIVLILTRKYFPHSNNS